MVKFLDLQKITQKYSIEIHEAVSRVIAVSYTHLTLPTKA